MMIPNTKSGAGETKRRVPDETFAAVGCRQLSNEATTDRYFIAEQPAPAPHLAYPKGCAALHIVIDTVPRVSRSCEHFSNGFDLHLLQRGDEAAKLSLSLSLSIYLYICIYIYIHIYIYIYYLCLYVYIPT